MNERPERPNRPNRPVNNGNPQQQQNRGPQNVSSQSGSQNNGNTQNNYNYNRDGSSPQNIGAGIEQQYFEEQKKAKKTRGKIALIIVGSILGIAILGVVVYFLSTGRISSRVVELEANVASLESTLESTIDSKDTEISNLNRAISEMTITELVPTTSLQRIEGTEIPELWLQEGDFIAPNELIIEGTSAAVNSSYMLIGSKYTITPSERWLISIQGAIFELSHPNNIWARFRALSSKEVISVDVQQEAVKNFFVGYPSTDITYRKLYIDDKQVGVLANATITVKQEVDGSMEILVDDVSIEGTELEEVFTEEVVAELADSMESVETEIVDTEVVEEENTGTIEENGIEDETEVLIHEDTGVSYTEKQMTITIGSLSKSEYALTFFFIHDTDGGSTSTELIDLLLTTVSYGPSGSRLKLE